MNRRSEIGDPREVTVFILARALVYASLFIGLALIFVPARFMSWSGIIEPSTIGMMQVAGLAIGAAGAATALWCVLTFALVGKGTPAPFDPPRRLVIRGPYRLARNPMYIGAGFALAGAALFYESWTILGYTGLFFLATHLFVVLYEEPALRKIFGQEYEAYSSRVGRWGLKKQAGREP